MPIPIFRNANIVYETIIWKKKKTKKTTMVKYSTTTTTPPEIPKSKINEKQ